MGRLLLILFMFSGQNASSSRLSERRFVPLMETNCSVDQMDSGHIFSKQNLVETDQSTVQESKKSILVGSTIRNSVLSVGHWVKVQAYEPGIHRITFTRLKSMGFQIPQKVKIFGFPPGPLPQPNQSVSADDLIQCATWQTKDKQSNDCLLLFIPGFVKWDFDPSTRLFSPVVNHFSQGKTMLFLTDKDDIAANLIQKGYSREENPSMIVREFDDFVNIEEENYNLIGSGSRWFSTLLTPNSSITKTFKFPNHVNNEPFQVSVAAAGRCDFSSSLDFSVNNSTSQTLNFSPYSNFAEADYADLRESAFSKTLSGDDLSFTLKYNGTSNGQCWLDYIRVQTRRTLNMLPGQLQFCDSRSVGSGNIVEFQIGNSGNGVKIWDVSNSLNPVEILSAFNGGILSFRVTSDSLRRFVAFDPLYDFPGIEQPEVVINQNLHNLTTPDMLIVTSAEFNSEAERLAAYHRQTSGMEVTVINVPQIYNEFSGGIADVTAIRNFVRFLYYKSYKGTTSKLKYLLLFGKGTYDNVHSQSAQNPDFVPTWQSESSINPVSSFVSDDYFGLLEENEGGQSGIVDIGIGRIPCVNILQAKAAVDKTIRYNSTSGLGEWRNTVSFVADDGDNNVHVSESEQLAEFVNHNYPALYTDKIYLDAYPEQTTPTLSYPGVNKAINARIKEGALLINYVGHANEEEWAAEKVLTINDIDSWTNLDKLPVFVTATCEFSRWDMTDKESAGEHVLFNQVGGGVALFSTTRIVYSSSNFEMNKSFFKYVFEKDSLGDNLRMGDVFRLAKSEMGGSINASKFGLMGDPALQMSYPKYKVKTLEINNQSVEQLNDTIKPLDLVSVWGEIQDLKGAKLTGYNGILYPNVYDKPTKASTLGNGGQTPFNYTIQNSILFKGNVTVKNGEFSYSFEIPKEINYQIGNGLIRNYSKNADSDANGSFTEFKLGGSPTTILSDVTGPSVKLFLDNENFKSGDKVSKGPLLLASLEDESGINTSGSAIGHDITVVIDNQADNMIVLNSYFQSGLDTYKNGKVIFQLPEMSDGEHLLKFKVWDLANNSTQIEIRFLVSSGLVIKKVITSPNPFNDFIDFIVEYNRYSEKMNVEIEIFNQQGMLVDQIKTDSGSSGFTTQPIRWSPGLVNHRPAAGIYYYRLRLTAIDGSTDRARGELIYTR